MLQLQAAPTGGLARYRSSVAAAPIRQRQHLGLGRRRQQREQNDVFDERPIAAAAAAAAASTSQQQQQNLPPRIQLPGIDGEIALTPEPEGPGIIPASMRPAADWARPDEASYTPPSIRASGTLRPGPEWFPAWMRYRRREDNYVFWQDKFVRCSLEIPGARRRRVFWVPQRKGAAPAMSCGMQSCFPRALPSPPQPPPLPAQARRSAGRSSRRSGSS